MTVHTGRHFLQIPGPTNVPDRVLRAMDMPTMDHRGPEFAEIGHAVLAGMQRVFRTKQPVIIYPSSGTGAWEAAIVNTLQPGDKVLMAETGQFAILWRGIAEKFKLDVDFLPGDWRHGADLEQIEARLSADKAHKIKAVCVVHNETSTGCVTHPLEVRKILDRVKHPALLMVDTISGLGSLEYEHDAWGIDVSVAGSQKGLMLPPGLGFNAVSEKALAVAKANPAMRSYWDWQEVIAINKVGTWPYTPATNLLFGLREAVKMLEEEGLENVFARHKRHSAATRAAAKVWELETQCQEQGAHSPALTGVVMPEGHDADNFRKVVLENFDMSLGTGLNKIKGKVFRIGHIGHFNDLMLMGTLSGVEMGLDLAKVPHRGGGVLAAMEVLKGRDVVPMPKAAVRLKTVSATRKHNNRKSCDERPGSCDRRPDLFRRGRHRPPDLQPSAGAQRADLCDVRADGGDLRDRQRRSLDQGDDPDRHGRQGVRIGYRHFAVPRLQDRAGCARLRSADRPRARRAGSVPGADDCGHRRRLHRRRRGDRRLLRHPHRHRDDADRFSDRAHARQLPVDVQHLRLVSLVGPARTKDLIFKARLVEAPEALALGLLNEVVPDVATLQRRADETAKLVASHAPITLEVTKEAVRRIRRTLSRDEGEDLILRAYMSEDFREGMDAFLNKRTPNWKGK